MRAERNAKDFPALDAKSEANNTDATTLFAAALLFAVCVTDEYNTQVLE